MDKELNFRLKFIGSKGWIRNYCAAVLEGFNCGFKKNMRVVVLYMLVWMTSAVFAGNIEVSCGNPEGDVGRLAVEELDSYLDKIFFGEVKLNAKAWSSDIVVGTVKDNKLVAKAVKSGNLALAEGKNDDQGYVIKTIGKTIYVAGKTEVGVLYGVYELLEQYGAYFQISGEILPDKTNLSVKQLDISETPVFKYRGLMPWDNFLCGMSGYNLEDSQELIRRATRMKYNLMNLHFYPDYVMYNEVWDGKAVKPSWVAQPNEFAPKGKPGEKAFGDMDLMCVRPWTENKGDPLKQAEACQQMFRDVIDYGHSYGWAFVAGFALTQPRGGDFTYTDKAGDSWDGSMNMPDPLVDKNIDLQVQRYRRLSEIYPNADYYWMWQSEGEGGLGRNISKTPGHKEMREKYSYWGDENRAGDRDYAYMFLKVAEKLTKEERSKLATGGWDIQHLFPGIDKDFPKELIFASLNHAYKEVSLNELDNYRVAANGRRAWMIAWWEFDGNQWFPQFRASWHEKKYNNAVKYGVEGVSLLGWKLSGIEHHLRYLSDFAWNPGLSEKDFYRDYISRVYGNAVVDEIAAMFERYEEWEEKTPPAVPGDYRPMLLGAGWGPMAIVNVPFTKEGMEAQKWKNQYFPCAEKCINEQNAFMKEDLNSIKVLNKLLPKMSPDGQEWAKLLINRFEFRVLYMKSTIEINNAYLTYRRVATEQSIKAGAAAAQKYTKKAIELAALAIEKYAEDVRNRSDLGVIGQLNAQYYDLFVRFNDSFNLHSLYADIDLERFPLSVAIRSDFKDNNCWPVRDGVSKIETFTEDNSSVIKLSLGDKSSDFNSRWIHRGEINLNEAPYLDFHIRTDGDGPVSLMFQVEDRVGWFEIALLGTQNYILLDKVNIVEKINDGNWHRITWDLQKMVNEKIGQDVSKIKDMIIGNWQKVDEPVVLEFKNFKMGSLNLLDGLEQDNTQ